MSINWMFYDSMFEAKLKRRDMKGIETSFKSIEKHIMIANMKKLGYSREDADALFRRGGYIYDEAGDPFTDDYYEKRYEYMLQRYYEEIIGCA